MQKNEKNYVDHGTQNFLDALNSSGGTPLEELSPEAARAVLTDVQKSVELQAFATDVSKKTITVNNKEVNLTIVRPAGNNEKLPVFMFFHGGGWVLGDFPTHERLISDLVVHSGAVAVYVDYTPSPEAQYPTAIHQAYAASKWVADNAAQINVDGSRLAVVGNSVGGNMAAVIALMAKEKNEFLIKFQGLLWPVTDANFDTASYDQFEQGYFLTRNMMRWFWDNYTTSAAKRNEIFASPIRASTEQLQGLPATLIQTAENDVLRDEGESYGKKLDAAGVNVTITRYRGMIHDFGLLNVLSNLPTTQSAIRQMAAELRFHLAS